MSDTDLLLVEHPCSNKISGVMYPAKRSKSLKSSSHLTHIMIVQNCAVLLYRNRITKTFNTLLHEYIYLRKKFNFE